MLEHSRNWVLTLHSLNCVRVRRQCKRVKYLGQRGCKFRAGMRFQPITRNLSRRPDPFRPSKLSVVSATRWISFLLLVKVAFPLCNVYPVNLQGTLLQCVRSLRPQLMIGTKFAHYLLNIFSNYRNFSQIRKYKLTLHAVAPHLLTTAGSTVRGSTLHYLTAALSAVLSNLQCRTASTTVRYCPFCSAVPLARQCSVVPLARQCSIVQFAVPYRQHDSAILSKLQCRTASTTVQFCPNCSAVPLARQCIVVQTAVPYRQHDSAVSSKLQCRTASTTVQFCPNCSVVPLARQCNVVQTAVPYRQHNSAVSSKLQCRTPSTTVQCCPNCSVVPLARQCSVVQTAVSYRQHDSAVLSNLHCRTASKTVRCPVCWIIPLRMAALSSVHYQYRTASSTVCCPMCSIVPPNSAGK